MGDFPLHLRLGEERLAALLGVSRTPVREALLRLHAEGLVGRPPRGRLPAHRPRRRRGPRPLRGAHGPRAAGPAPAGRARHHPRPGRPRAPPGRVAGARRRAARARPGLRHPRRGLPRAVGRGVGEPVAGRPAPHGQRAHPRGPDARLPHRRAGRAHRSPSTSRSSRPCWSATCRSRSSASVATWASPWPSSSSGRPRPWPAWPAARARCAHEPSHPTSRGGPVMTLDRGSGPHDRCPGPARRAGHDLPLRRGGGQRLGRLRGAGGRGPRPAGRERRRQEHPHEADLRRLPARLGRDALRRRAGEHRLAGRGPRPRHRHGVPGPAPGAGA